MVEHIVAIRDPKLAEIVRRLVDALHPTRIYLFGSRARGDATEESDYDLLVLVPQPREELRQLHQAAYDAIWGVGASVDVVVFSVDYFERLVPVVASLPATVEREGKLLYAA